jgi:acetoacetyl-CoA synthetase
MRDMGVRPGDAVFALMPNIPETVVAMLAAISIGAVWSNAASEFGRQSILDRFAQVKPK